MSKQWSLWSFLALFFPSTIVLGIHAYIGSFNRFIADDFCSAYFAQRLGLLRSVWYWYKSWFGDFSSSIVDGIMPTMGVRGLTFSVVVTLIIWLILTISAVWLLLPKNISRKEKTLAAFSFGAAIIFVTLLVSPNVLQSLYWWGGMRAYIPPLLFATFYLILFQLFRQKTRSTREQVVWGGISLLVSFFGCGFSETFSPVHVVLMIFLIGLGLSSGKMKPGSTTFPFLMTGLLGSTTALVVMVLAPGNALRQTFFPATPGIFTIFSISLSGYFAFLRDLVGSPDKVSGLAGFSLAAIWLGTRAPAGSGLKGWIAPALLLAGFILAFGCFPSSAYGMSDVPPARTLVIAVYYLVVSMAVSGFIFGQWLSTRLESRAEFRVNLVFGLCVLLFMVFSAWTNGQTLFASSQQFRDYAVNWDRMNARIFQAKAAGDTQVIIPIMTNWAGLDNASDNPRFWVNVCMSRYYEINIITPPIDR